MTLAFPIGHFGIFCPSGRVFGDKPLGWVGNFSHSAAIIPTTRAQCAGSKFEDELHFLFDCPKYSDIRKTAFTHIKNSTGINLTNDFNRINNLKKLFKSDNLNSLNAFGKYVKNAFELRIT